MRSIINNTCHCLPVLDEPLYVRSGSCSFMQKYLSNDKLDEDLKLDMFQGLVEKTHTSFDCLQYDLVHSLCQRDQGRLPRTTRYYDKSMQSMPGACKMMCLHYARSTLDSEDLICLHQL